MRPPAPKPVKLHTLIAQCEARGMTRAAIAKATGLSRSYITCLAQQDRGRSPSWRTVAELQALSGNSVTEGTTDQGMTNGCK